MHDVGALVRGSMSVAEERAVAGGPNTLLKLGSWLSGEATDVRAALDGAIASASANLDAKLGPAAHLDEAALHLAGLRDHTTNAMAEVIALRSRGASAEVVLAAQSVADDLRGQLDTATHELAQLRAGIPVRTFEATLTAMTGAPPAPTLASAQAQQAVTEVSAQDRLAVMRRELGLSS